MKGWAVEKRLESERTSGLRTTAPAVTGRTAT
jgi:hypothetical protein